LTGSYGQAAMYTLPHNQRNWMPEYAAVFMVATTTLLGIRLYSRFQGRSGNLGFDDALIVIAWALATTTVGIIIFCKFGGRQSNLVLIV
jgi:hypothetical protein